MSVSENIKHPDAKGVKNISNLDRVFTTEKSSYVPSGIPSRGREKGSKMPNMIDLASTSLRRSIRLANKPKQKYGFFC